MRDLASPSAPSTAWLAALTSNKRMPRAVSPGFRTSTAARPPPIIGITVCVLVYEDSIPHVPQHPWRLAVGAIPTRFWEPNGTKEFVDIVEHLDIQ